MKYILNLYICYFSGASYREDLRGDRLGNFGHWRCDNGLTIPARMGQAEFRTDSTLPRGDRGDPGRSVVQISAQKPPEEAKSGRRTPAISAPQARLWRRFKVGVSRARGCVDSRLLLEAALSRIDPDALSDESRLRLAPLMPGGCKGKRGPCTDNRCHLDALLWMTRADGRWRDLP